VGQLYRAVTNAILQRKAMDVLLCIDCLDDWLPAGVDPYFADRIIAEALVYLDDTGHESKNPTDRYVETVLFDELTPGHPRRCDGCKMRWDELGGHRIVYRAMPASTSSDADEGDGSMNQNGISYGFGLGGTVEEVGGAARRLAVLLEAIADSRCVSEMSIMVDPEKDEDSALMLSIQHVPGTHEAAWRQLLRKGSELGYRVEEGVSTDEDLPEGQNTFDIADVRID